MSSAWQVVRTETSNTSVYLISRLVVKSTEVEYAPLTLPNFLHSEYSGRNHHEIDLKWHELLDNISLRATDDEMAKNHNHQTSVRLPVGGGQLVWLEASHHLHCVVSHQCRFNLRHRK